MAERKKGLGRGLDSLLGIAPAEETPKKAAVPASAGGVTELKLSLVEPNRDQPRKNFDEEKIEILAESIRVHGVVQPILVRPRENGYYMIIAGERRWRAAKKAGLKTIPAIVKNFEEQKIMEIALVENLQREDLNPIDTANGYRFLSERFSMTQDEISKKVGKSRSAITNTLRLLTLPDSVQQLMFDGRLSEGHARALIGLPPKDAGEIAEEIVRDGLSVRRTEELVRQKKAPVKPEKKISKDVHLRSVEKNLAQQLSTKVEIVPGRRKSKIVIEYYGTDDLNRILEKIGK